MFAIGLVFKLFFPPKLVLLVFKSTPAFHMEYVLLVPLSTLLDKVDTPPPMLLLVDRLCCTEFDAVLKLFDVWEKSNEFDNC